jgi:hypothetical protein
MSSFSQRAPAQSHAPVMDSGETSLGGGAEMTEATERGEAKERGQKTPLDTVKELIKKADGPGLVSNFAALSRSQPGEVVKLVADRATLVSALKVIGQDQATLALCTCSLAPARPRAARSTTASSCSWPLWGSAARAGCSSSPGGTPRNKPPWWPTRPRSPR